MTRHTLVKIAAVLGAVAFLGCTMMLQNVPPQGEFVEARKKIAMIQIGKSPESGIRELFPRPENSQQIGIVETSTYRSEGYVSRDYWIGYRGFESTPGSRTVTTRYVLITCVNGVVDSIYWP